MTNHQDIVHGGWWQTVAGWVVSAFGWFGSGMNGATLLLTVLTIVLSAIKIADAVRRWRSVDGGLKDRWKAVTRPGGIE